MMMMTTTMMMMMVMKKRDTEKARKEQKTWGKWKYKNCLSFNFFLLKPTQIQLVMFIFFLDLLENEV